MNTESMNRLVFHLPKWVTPETRAEFLKEVDDYLAQFGAALVLTAEHQDREWIPVYFIYCPQEFVGVIMTGMRKQGCEIV